MSVAGEHSGSELLDAFVTTVAVEQTSPSAEVALRAILERDHEDSAEPELEFRRTRVLAERAAFIWAARALESAGHREEAYGLLSLQVGGQAPYVATVMRNRYALGLDPSSDAAAACNFAADALFQAIGLGRWPGYVRGCGVAAGLCLAALGRLGEGTNVVVEARLTATQLLDQPLAAWLTFE